MNIHKTLDNQTNLTPLSQPEPITQESPNPNPQVKDLNNIIEEMDIKNTPNKRNPSTPSTETKNQDETYEDANQTTSDSAKKNRDRAASRKARLNKAQKKGHTQS